MTRSDPSPNNGSLATQLPDHLPPQSLESEQATLGAALISKTAVSVVLDTLDREDFYIEAHRRVYDGIARLAAKDAPVDSLSLGEDLKLAGHLEAMGGMAYLNSLWESVPTAAHVRHYARVVREKSALRKQIEASTLAIAECHEQRDEVEEIIAAAEGRQAAVRHKLIPAKGPEVISMRELISREFAPPAWVVKDLLPAGVCLLAGPPKAKKSFFALGVALALSAGGKALGAVPVEKSGCLCVFLEDRFAEVKERAVQLLNGEPAPEGLDVVEQAPRMDEGGETWLDKYLTEHPECKFIVLDPLVRVRGGRRRQALGRSGNAYDDDYEDLEAFKRLCDRHGVCLLILHHTRKLPADDWLQSLNGSTAITGAADAILALQAERGDLTATLKATGRRVRDRDDLLTWGDHTGWTLVGPAEQATRTREQDDVVSVLKDHGRPMRYTALVNAVCDATGKKQDAIKKRVSRMAEQGLILKEGSLYFLSSRVTAMNTRDLGAGDMGTEGTGGTQGDIGDTFPSLSEVSPPETPVLSLPSDGDIGTQGTEGTRGDTGDSNSQPDLDQALRYAVLTQAMAQDWPGIVFDEDRQVPEGEPAWQKFCRTVHVQWVSLAGEALRARGETR